MSRPILIFYDPSFPSSMAVEAPSDILAKDGIVVDADGLGEALRTAEGGCFVNLHAPYFPKSVWPEILAFLKRGGGLLSIGGAAFKRPVRSEADGWHVEAEQTAYHQELHIHEMLHVEAAPIRTYKALETIPLLNGYESLFPIADTWNLVPHTTRNSDLPHQMGAAGTMSTQIHPLLKGISADGREVAAPVVLWENSRGAFVGSRWIFVNVSLHASFWQDGGAQALLEWAAFCAKGVTELWIKPNYASYEAGEHAVLTLQTQVMEQSGDSALWTFDLTVEHVDGVQTAWTHRLKAEVNKEFNVLRIHVPEAIQSGLYRVTCKAEAEDGEIRVLRQGFWGHDPILLAQGNPITCGRDYFIKDERPLPVVGMTYMTSDVARKFLFLPNADVWDRDMAQMAKAGINWIRTGIWTAYRNVMQVDGHASEEVMRAIDAFFLTAKKHNLQVTFTFFSFTPETWEGVNPYLDPQSVEAQKRFIRSIVSRHRTTTHVDWDLINEPSMFDPAQIFSDGPRSCKDAFEQKAFVEWLEQRHGSIELLQERWNMSPEQLPSFAAATIPEAGEINFDVQDMHRAKKGTRWLDYCLFAMDMHNRWAKELYDTIKELCPEHLVVVGQDEALGAQRPSPFFYQEAVDYTTVHSWWLNDNLVWDGIFAKTHNKPNVIQETGIMYVETPDGRAKRSEHELRSMLERKYAYAFSTGGAGAVHWIWNTNFYMDNANESHIGALRADGTEKPEADVSYAFGQFMGEIRDLFQERELEDIVAIFPYSNDLSNRKLAFDATTRLTRVLAYEMNMPFRGASEYHLDVLEDQPPKLIVLPSAHNIDEQAWNKLVDIVKHTGAILLATGPISLDAYWKQTPRLTNELGISELQNVRREELLHLQGTELPVSFGQRRIAQVVKEVRTGSEGASSEAVTRGDAVVDVALGKGRLIWSPLPLELNERTDTMMELYRYAIQEAGCQSGLHWIQGGDIAGVYGRKLRFKSGFLYVFVSEFAWNVKVEVKDTDSDATYAFTLEKERSVLFAADLEGKLLSVYRPHEVHIERS
ncbi:glycoside hydrolase [Paenibacillus sp. SYP-B3998]|uniref:Glycoside hydrolase n=1 Tax=Paenibacillus sp. SYP-B3998 TaxID=2678564 RepID=A0A6G4A2V7_9BACL|nr:beta-galactosidase [Paenibacillus sp. SYP-B3998]NEW08149.1 glycoside hydrolase [Paenibacillus sp. SYP-B3998]